MVVRRRLQLAAVAGAGGPPWPRGWQGGGGWWLWGAVAAGAPAPDLTPPPPTLSAPVRSDLRPPQAAGVAFVLGVGKTWGPKKYKAGSAGHDDGDA